MSSSGPPGGIVALERAHLTCEHCDQELSAHAGDELHCLFSPTVFRALTQADALLRQYKELVKLHYIFYG